MSGFFAYLNIVLRVAFWQENFLLAVTLYLLKNFHFHILHFFIRFKLEFLLKD
jgi:hypothetical protein